MNEYRQALNSIILAFADRSYSTKSADNQPTIISLIRIMGELVDRSEENFTHILKVRTDGCPSSIAFHTSKEAQKYAEKHNLKGCRLESIQFAKGDKE